MLSLFFIDEVAKYRRYDQTGEQPGEYAQDFEEEYKNQLNEILMLEDTPYNRYLKSIAASATHNGYFSIDKKSKHVYFSAETKGSLSSKDFGRIEECKIDCARKFFSKITSDQAKYDVVDSYGKLMELVK